MRNKSVIITGATAGIGRAVALQLASLGADVVVTGRDAERGRVTQEALRAAGSPGARFVRADHSTLQGNLALAAEVKESVDQVDVLVNNVGGLIPRRETTADGVEMTLALNLRASVVLTEQLRPVFARDGLVVNVASDAFVGSRATRSMASTTQATTSRSRPTPGRSSCWSSPLSPRRASSSRRACASWPSTRIRRGPRGLRC